MLENLKYASWVTDRKSYGQFCALARALDHVGDRWTVLIIRELLLAPARYGELLGALPGLATNLLAQRLRQLEIDGLVERTTQGGSPYAMYRLTLQGRALEPVLLALIRWGARYMDRGPGGDVVDDRWAWLAMRALLETKQSRFPHGEVGLRCGESQFTVLLDAHGRHVLATTPRQPRAVVVAALPALLVAVAHGDWARQLSIEGDAVFAREALTPLP